MDVHCTTCGEPWDVYHLWHEAIFETRLSHEEAEAWRLLPRAEKLNDCYREEFRSAGWEFGHSVITLPAVLAVPKTANQILSDCKPKLHWRNCLETTRTGWPPHSRTTDYERRSIFHCQVQAWPHR